MKITHNGRPYTLIGRDWYDDQNLKVNQQEQLVLELIAGKMKGEVLNTTIWR